MISCMDEVPNETPGPNQAQPSVYLRTKENVTENSDRKETKMLLEFTPEFILDIHKASTGAMSCRHPNAILVDMGEVGSNVSTKSRGFVEVEVTTFVVKECREAAAQYVRWYSIEFEVTLADLLGIAWKKYRKSCNIWMCHKPVIHIFFGCVRRRRALFTGPKWLIIILQQTKRNSVVIFPVARAQVQCDLKKPIYNMDINNQPCMRCWRRLIS